MSRIRREPNLKLLGVVVLALFLSSCGILTEPDNARQILVNQGYTNIEITGYRWFSCGEDTFSTGFKAISPAGHPVSGVICAGWMKDSTIRLDN